MPAYQSEVVDRLNLPFPLLSDASQELSRALQLPTMDVAGMHLLKRVTLVTKDGAIEHVIYPVFPPPENAAEVMRYLRDVRRNGDPRCSPDNVRRFLNGRLQADASEQVSPTGGVCSIQARTTCST